MIPIYLNYSGKRIYQYIDPKISVSQFRKNISNFLSIDEDSLRLIFAGKIITNDFNMMTLTKECCINVMGRINLEIKDGYSNEQKIEMFPSYVLLQIKYNKNVHGIQNEIICLNNMCVRTENFVVCKIDDNKQLKFQLYMRANNSLTNKKNIKQPKNYTFNIQSIDKTYYKFKYYDIDVLIRAYRIPIMTKDQNNIIANIIKKNKVTLTTELIEQISGYIKWRPLIQEIQHYLNLAIMNDTPIPNYKFVEMNRIYSNYLNCNVTGIKYIEILNYRKINTNEIIRMSKYINYLDNDHMLIETFTQIHTLKIISDMLINNVQFNIIQNLEIDNIKRNIIKKICHNCYEDKDIFVGSNIMYCDTCFKGQLVNELIEHKNPIIDIKYVCYYINSDTINDILLQIYINSNKTLIKCPNKRCLEIYEYIGHSSAEFSPYCNIMDKNYSSYASDRILCRTCNTEFCKKCNLDPYHVGFTCSQYKEYLESDKCKYCLGMINKIDNMCKNTECIEYTKICPNLDTTCGHPNYGFNKYEVCLQCTNDYNMEKEMCYICMTDELHKKPCIKLECGHIYHLNCLEHRFTSKHNTSHINLNYTYCSVCNFRVSHPYINDKYMNELQKLNIKIEKKSYRHMKNNKDPQNMTELTITEHIDNLRYYECSDCNKIYLGGLADCQDDARDIHSDSDSDSIIEKKCLACGAFGKNKCKKHGDKNILYKCCYCCKVAVWYCYGTTHFCESCHSNTYKIKAQPCRGGNDCPLYGKHPKNDEKTQFAIGCSICISDDIKKRLDWAFNNIY